MLGRATGRVDAGRQCTILTLTLALPGLPPATRARSETQRHYYTTPTSYLELLRAYCSLLSAKRAQLAQLRNRYGVGLTKLLAAEQEVSVMKQELIALQPRLVQTGAGQGLVTPQPHPVGAPFPATGAQSQRYLRCLRGLDLNARPVCMLPHNQLLAAGCAHRQRGGGNAGGGGPRDTRGGGTAHGGGGRGGSGQRKGGGGKGDQGARACGGALAMHGCSHPSGWNCPALCTCR